VHNFERDQPLDLLSLEQEQFTKLAKQKGGLSEPLEPDLVTHGLDFRRALVFLGRRRLSIVGGAYIIDKRRPEEKRSKKIWPRETSLEPHCYFIYSITPVFEF